MHKRKKHNDLGLAIVSSESLTPAVPVCWRQAKARERGGMWWGYLYQTGGDRPQQTVNRSPGGLQAAVQQTTGVGDTPTWEKLLFLEAEFL